jgi:DNA-directed RNA polymerase subunit RPC12/RpoP
MKDNKLKIAITCPHCDFESKTNLFSYGLKILCTRCKKDFILDDSIKVKYSFYCPHCNKYGSSRNILVGKKAICRKCRGEMLISKQGVKRVGKTFGNVVKLFFFISIIFTLYNEGPALLYIIIVFLGAAGVIHPF